MFDHSVDLDIKAEKAMPDTAEKLAEGYRGLIGAHPEESLRTRK